jgi:hypothetical protein
VVVSVSYSAPSATRHKTACHVERSETSLFLVWAAFQR